MTEVLPVTAPEALHGADSEPTLQQCNEVFESDEDLGIIAEAVFGDSSEEEYAKTSDDDTPRSAVPSDAPKIVGVDKSNDLLQKEDKDSKKMQDPCVDPISNDTPSSIEGIRAPVANPRVVHQPQQQVQPSSRSHCVLVAKCLTNSDASSGRIILPRVAVEANLPFVTGYRHYALTVHDRSGRRYDFMIKSWANGNESRRVFVLEQATEFLRIHRIGVGDTIGICADGEGQLLVEANTDAVRHATVSPRYGALALAHPPLSAATSGAVPLAATASGRCARSAHCTKPAGHPGFCSGPKAAAAAAAGQPQSRQHTKGRRSRLANSSSDGRRFLAHANGYRHHAKREDNSTAVIHEEYSSDETAATNLHLNDAAFARHQRRDPVLNVEHPLMPTDIVKPLSYIPTGVYITKSLTQYDISSMRIILPAEDVEDMIPQADTLDISSVAAVDESEGWHFFTMRTWRTIGDRRGYLLDGAGDFLSNRRAAPGDVLVLYREEDASPPRVEVRCKAFTADQEKGDVGDVRRPFFPASNPLPSSHADGNSSGSDDMTDIALNAPATVSKKTSDGAVMFSDMPLLMHPNAAVPPIGTNKDPNAAVPPIGPPIGTNKASDGSDNKDGVVPIFRSRSGHGSSSVDTPTLAHSGRYPYRGFAADSNSSDGDDSTIKSHHHHHHHHHHAFSVPTGEQGSVESDAFGMTCQRTNGCTKAPGHQGFCSGHKGFKRKDVGGPSVFGTFTHRQGRQRRAARQSGKRSHEEDFYDEDDRYYYDADDAKKDGLYQGRDGYDFYGSAWQTEEDEEYSPTAKKARPGYSAVPQKSGNDPLLSLLSLLDA